MSKSDDRAQLDALLAQFKGEIKRAPPAPAAAQKGKRIRGKPATEVKRKTQGVGEVSVTEAADGKPTTHLHAPTGPDLGNIETDSGRGHAHASDLPGDLAHRDPLRGLGASRLHRALAKILGTGEDDGDDGDQDHHWFEEVHGLQTARDRELEARFRTAAESGGHCAECGGTLKPAEPVWHIRRKLEGKNIEIDYGDRLPAIYETEELVASICEQCWQGRGRVTLTQRCGGCGRPVHITPKALKSWLARGQRAYCCEDCTRRPPAQSDGRLTRACAVCGKDFELKRLDAMCCGAACRQKASRARKKVHPAA